MHWLFALCVVTFLACGFVSGMLWPAERRNFDGALLVGLLISIVALNAFALSGIVERVVISARIVFHVFVGGWALGVLYQLWRERSQKSE